jgi:hypothetical protein
MGIQRASPNDVMELMCDVSGTSMQVAAVLVLQTRSPVEVAAVRSAIADRVPAVPLLRQRLVDTPFGCGHPVWIDDPGFDIGNHVNRPNALHPATNVRCSRWSPSGSPSVCRRAGLCGRPP